MNTTKRTLVDATAEPFKPRVIELIKGLRAGRCAEHNTGPDCAFQYLIEQLALPGPQSEFCWRYAGLASAVVLLAKEGRLTLSGESVNPNVWLEGELAAFGPPCR